MATVYMVAERASEFLISDSAAAVVIGDHVVQDRVLALWIGYSAIGVVGAVTLLAIAAGCRFVRSL
jgi:hypothetical protein